MSSHGEDTWARTMGLGSFRSRADSNPLSFYLFLSSVNQDFGFQARVVGFISGAVD